MSHLFTLKLQEKNGDWTRNEGKGRNSFSFFKKATFGHRDDFFKRRKTVHTMSPCTGTAMMKEKQGVSECPPSHQQGLQKALSLLYS